MKAGMELFVHQNYITVWTGWNLEIHSRNEAQWFSYFLTLFNSRIAMFNPIKTTSAHSPSIETPSSKSPQAASSNIAGASRVNPWRPVTENELTHAIAEHD